MLIGIGNFIGNYSSGGEAPDSFDNLEWWITADDGLTLLDESTSVDSWHDLSGNNHNLIALTSASHLRATYEATGLNGKPAAKFATSDFTYQATLGAKFSKAVPFTIGGAIQIDGVADSGILTNSIAADDRFQISIVSGHLNFAYFNGTSWIGHQVQNIATGIYYFIFKQHPGTADPVLYLNGEAIETTDFVSNGSIAANGIYVLGSVRQTSTVSQFNGKVRDMFLYSDLKSEADIARLNTYLTGII